MSRRLALLGFAAALLSSSGCSEESHTPTAPAPTLSVTAAPTAVVADGVNTVTLTVTDTGGGPVTVTTNRGTLPGGGTSASVAGASGTLALLTCDAATAGCAGTATITATSATGTATTTVTFGALAPMCALSCGADANCAGLACNLSTSGTGSCSATSPSTCVAAPACTATSGDEVACGDDKDDDCDGDIDCDDAACDGQPCLTGSPTFLCESGTCTDTTSGLALEIVPARTRLPANGTTTTTVAVNVTSAGAPVGGMGVTISTTLGGLSATTGTTGADGTATFTFTASNTAGVATIAAYLTAVTQIADTATITMPRLGSFQIPDPSSVHAVMGVKGSGWNELGGVIVKVLDDTGAAYPDGLAVRFEHRKLGGSTFGAPLATTSLGACTAAANCVAYDATTTSAGVATDTAGLATAPVYSGTVAGTLAFTATTTAGGVTRTVTLPTVAVVGAKASGTNFSVDCSPRNVPALAETNCSVSRVDAPFTCVAFLEDRFGNVLGTETQVTFAVEAGSGFQFATTPAYDPATAASEQAELGTALQIFQTLDQGLPFDVPADTAAGEPVVSHNLDGCGVNGPLDHNPRDGVVTLVAIADGEEGFFDANGNGAYDAGEPFIDQGEPFVDQDDSGAWEPGEAFEDVDGDGAYTPANGAWDAQTKIWTQTVVVYTGPAATLVTLSGDLLGTRWADNDATTTYFVDACTPTAPATPFSVDAKVAGPTEIPATSQGYVVVASDLNLNFLTTATSYDVDVFGGSQVTATYRGLPGYSDELGFFYRYLPCDQPATGTPSCAAQCRATVGGASGTGPCVMRPSLSAFSCGVPASVTITGGDKAAPLVEVDWTVVTPWKVQYEEKDGIVIRPLFGTVN